MIPAERLALTYEGDGLGVDDATGQKVEVILLAVHHHGVSSVVAPLGTEIWLSVQEPGPGPPRQACQASYHSRGSGDACGWWLCPESTRGPGQPGAVVGSDVHLGCAGLVPQGLVSTPRLVGTYQRPKEVSQCRTLKV